MSGKNWCRTPLARKVIAYLADPSKDQTRTVMAEDLGSTPMSVRSLVCRLRAEGYLTNPRTEPTAAGRKLIAKESEYL